MEDTMGKLKLMLTIGFGAKSGTAWLVVWSPLKNMKVSWGQYSQLNGNKNMFQTTNQNILEYETVKDSSVLVMI